jgi:hypothetical protein
MIMMVIQLVPAWDLRVKVIDPTSKRLAMLFGFGSLTIFMEF